jgi:hypothetical protein
MYLHLTTEQEDELMVGDRNGSKVENSEEIKPRRNIEFKLKRKSQGLKLLLRISRFNLISPLSL